MRTNDFQRRNVDMPETTGNVIGSSTRASGTWVFTRRVMALLVVVLTIVMSVSCLLGMNAHERMEAVFDVHGDHPFPNEIVQEAVLRRLPLGMHEQEVAKFLSENGIPNMGTGSRFLLSTQAKALGMETNMLVCFIRSDNFKRQFIPSRWYQYLINFRLDASGCVTNVEVAGLEWCI